VPITYAEAPRVDHGISVDQVGAAAEKHSCSQIPAEQREATAAAESFLLVEARHAIVWHWPCSSLHWEDAVSVQQVQHDCRQGMSGR
jgi:hypothetical protein